jgi:hypothetical protein
VDADLDTLATARSRGALRRSELAGWADTATAPVTPATSGDYACTCRNSTQDLTSPVSSQREGNADDGTRRSPLAARSAIPCES